jgi:hypothetical protein
MKDDIGFLGGMGRSGDPELIFFLAQIQIRIDASSLLSPTDCMLS